ncbi:MAG: stage 0 sporulation family protein [Candidatus Eisenbacteria bacterium]|nr:stage 0 sporulation family protein [Candidatus Eisenbacteria bacterium]
MTCDYMEIRFKRGRQQWYANPEGVAVEVGDLVVVRADRGEDMGRVVHRAETPILPPGEEESLFEVVRPVDARDEEARMRNRTREEEAREICVTRIEARKLEMKLVDVEMQFDGNKITFYFTAEKRIDFRELVKDLASTFKTRIELRQIGVRDEAKRLDGCGPCGRRLCCSGFLRGFSPVTLRMARDQHLALAPNKISGVCGRLMCCLAYEREEYLRALSEFPKVGTRVRTEDMEGKALKADIFTRTVTVRTSEDKEVRVPLEAIREELRHDRWIPRKTGPR